MVNKCTTGNIPLEFAKALTELVNIEWNSGELWGKISPITAILLNFWFSDEANENRSIKFHVGQKQAILNAIYCFEVLKAKNVLDLYRLVEEYSGKSFINDNVYTSLKNDDVLKYCIKMATGTGKTFVMNALFIWQCLNAINRVQSELHYIKHFLIIAPGLIVYERLLDAFKGKINESGRRDFNTSDIKRNEALFVPKKFREILYSFIQNNTVEKDEIGQKITGDGLIAITNWQSLKEEKENFNSSDDNIVQNDISLKANIKMINTLLPITPNKNAGADLNILDAKYLNKNKIEYLTNLDELCIINDEAHHIHDEEIIWQKAITKIFSNKKNANLQLDFSATPYNNTTIKIKDNNAKPETKNYFPHIIVDFSLQEAIKLGIVKLVAIDERIKNSDVEDDILDFKSERDEDRKVLDLSKGQKIMIKAGLEKLNILQKHFVQFDKNKYPKMLIMCEDTQVIPFVENFLLQNGLTQDEFVRIDSKKESEIKEDEWKELKYKVFNIDKKENPKVIISVLMLREGFDVNNICVIVPLRSSGSNILLEQTIGRGLRLMWRGDDKYNELRHENIKKVLELKESPVNYLDVLSIIEHPAFLKFYENLDFVGEIQENSNIQEHPLGDLIKVGLKDGYEKYDFFWPVFKVEHDVEIELTEKASDIPPIECGYSFEVLQQMLKNKVGERFSSKEITAQTRFGEYKVDCGAIFDAKCYNEYLQRVIDIVSRNANKVSNYPYMQVYKDYFIGLIDEYIRNYMFGKKFNPLEQNNWKILMLENVNITQQLITHFIEILMKLDKQSENNIEIERKYFSEYQKEITIRENYSLQLQKTIYEKVGYPSNKGEFEKQFMIACNNSASVEAFLKIKEKNSDFIKLNYMRHDGNLASYFPDFLVRTKKYIFIVETKGDNIVDAKDTQKKKVAAFDFANRINSLQSEQRDNKEWYYVLLTDSNFYNQMSNNEDVEQMLFYFRCRNKSDEMSHNLTFDYFN